MRVLLIRCSTANYATPPPDTPSGLMYLASALREAGYDPTIRDLEFEPIGDDLADFDVIGITILSKARKAAFQTIHGIRTKAPKARIIVGGPHASSKPELLLNNLPIDSVIVGEGERTIIAAVQGTDREILYSNTIEDIDTISSPAYDLVDLDRYHMQIAKSNPDWVIDGLRIGDLKYAPVIASRGCPGRCIFCNAYKHWGLKIRQRSAESVVDEIERLSTEFGVQLIAFNDNCFPSTKRQGMAVCKEIVQRGVKILWKCDTRADIIDDELAQAMRASGCFMPAVGLESGSPEILKGIGKRLDLDKARESLKAIKNAGMLCYTLLMCGNPGESAETIDETVKFVSEIRPHYVSWVRGVMILPDTSLADISGVSDDFWTNGDDLPYYLEECSIEQLDGFVAKLQGIEKDPIPVDLIRSVA